MASRQLTNAQWDQIRPICQHPPAPLEGRRPPTRDAASRTFAGFFGRAQWKFDQPTSLKRWRVSLEG